MRTPYCAAIGVQRREVDEMRVVIGAEVSRLHEVDRRRSKLESDLLRERQVAASALNVPSTAYFVSMRAERARLEESQRILGERVAQLQSEAREAFGALSAVEGAAERYRDHEKRRLEGVEQAANDDRSAAAFLARHRLTRAAERRQA